MPLDFIAMFFDGIINYHSLIGGVIAFSLIFMTIVGIVHIIIASIHYVNERPAEVRCFIIQTKNEWFDNNLNTEVHIICLLMLDVLAASILYLVAIIWPIYILGAFGILIYFILRCIRFMKRIVKELNAKSKF